MNNNEFLFTDSDFVTVTQPPGRHKRASRKAVFFALLFERIDQELVVRVRPFDRQIEHF